MTELERAKEDLASARQRLALYENRMAQAGMALIHEGRLVPASVSNLTQKDAEALAELINEGDAGGPSDAEIQNAERLTEIFPMWEWTTDLQDGKWRGVKARLKEVG